jgi:hypothetical protein
VVIICLTVLWGALRPEQFSALLDHADRDTTGLVKGVLFSAYVLNLIPDYISGLQTHRLIGFVQARKSFVVSTFPVLLIDVIFKTVIFLVSYTVFVVIFASIYYLFKEIRDVWSEHVFTTITGAWDIFFKYAPYLSVENPGNPSLKAHPVVPG